MAKKAKKEAEVKVEAQVEQKPVEETKVEAQAETETKAEVQPERPAFPAGFCLDETTWASNERLLDEASESCKACQRDMADTYGTCKARDAFIAGQVVASKTARKSSGKTKEPSAPTQGSIINGMLKESKPLKDIIAAVAATYYGNNIKAADGRVKRHIQRGIIGGEARNAAEMKPYVAYLSAKKEEPKAEEQTAAATE
jgi:hypothetical protein